MSEEVGVSLTTQIEDHVSDELARLARAVENIDPALEEIGNELTTSVQMRFEREEDPEGTKWQNLSAVTLAHRLKGRDDGTPKILRDGGELYESVGQYKVLPGEAVVIGSNRKYARIQHFGGQAGRNLAVTIPARPYLGLNEDDRKAVVDILKDHIARAS